MLPFVLADLEDGHDARMVQVGGRLGLAVEALHFGLVGELAGENHLQCDGTIEARLAGLEDDAHAAAGDFADDLVVAEVADVSWCGGLSRGRRGRSEIDGRLVRGASVASSWTDDAVGPFQDTRTIPGGIVGASATVEGRGCPGRVRLLLGQFAPRLALSSMRPGRPL